MMKYILLIALFLIIDLAYSIGKCRSSNHPEIKEKVLLILYEERTDFKILKDYKKLNRRYKYRPEHLNQVPGRLIKTGPWMWMVFLH